MNEYKNSKFHGLWRFKSVDNTRTIAIGYYNNDRVIKYWEYSMIGLVYRV